VSATTATRSTGKASEPPVSPAELAQKHERALFRAHQVGHPVMYRGKQRFIHTFRSQIAGGGTQAELYLTGDATPVDPAEIQIQEMPT